MFVTIATSRQEIINIVNCITFTLYIINARKPTALLLSTERCVRRPSETRSTVLFRVYGRRQPTTVRVRQRRWDGVVPLASRINDGWMVVPMMNRGTLIPNIFCYTAQLKSYTCRHGLCCRRRSVAVLFQLWFFTYRLVQLFSNWMI